MPEMSRKKTVLWTCLLPIFSYLVVGGCTDPQALITPDHLTKVPGIQELQASVGFTSSGKPRVLLSWKYDSTSTNLRSWDVQRAINDSAQRSLSFFETVPKPTAGYPSYADSSGAFQSFTSDSLNIYYRIVPNGIRDNFVGEPSPRLHVILRR